MQTPLRNGPSRQRDVDALALNDIGQMGRLQLLLALRQMPFEDVLGLIRRRAQSRTLLLRDGAKTAKYLGQRTVPAQRGHAPLFEAVQIGNGLQPLKGLVGSPFDHVGLWLHGRGMRP